MICKKTYTSVCQNPEGKGADVDKVTTRAGCDSTQRSEPSVGRLKASKVGLTPTGAETRGHDVNKVRR